MRERDAGRTVLHCHSRSGTRPSQGVENGDFAEYFPRAVDAQELYPSVMRFADQLDAATFKDEHTVVGSTFVENEIAFAESPLMQMRNQLVYF